MDFSHEGAIAESAVVIEDGISSDVYYVGTAVPGRPQLRGRREIIESTYRGYPPDFPPRLTGMHCPGAGSL